jgi:3-oxoacyl-[acyl-carrier-protein] synthase II
MVFGTYTGPLETVSALTHTIGTEGPHRVSPRLFPNSVMNAAAGHACLSLQIRGPLSTVTNGCAAGVTGLGYAVDLIRRGEADAMLAVAADELTPLLHLGYDRLGVLTDTALRPYDRGRSGCALGAGGTAVVVESLAHAQQRSALILGEVHGHAVTSDAFRIAGNDPSGAAWGECFRRAADDADTPLDAIGVIYGDARGTSAVDIAEARAIAAVWRPGRVRLANLSGQVGHIHSATPLLSLVAALESSRSGWVPDIHGLREPVPPLEGFVGAAGDVAGKAGLVTSANWGGTYASVVVSAWTG